MLQFVRRSSFDMRGLINTYILQAGFKQLTPDYPECHGQNCGYHTSASEALILSWIWTSSLL